MKQVVLAFFSLLLAIPSFAQSAEDSYKKAIDFCKKDDFAKAKKNIDDALEQLPNNEDYLLLQARIFLALEQYQESFDTYSGIIESNPKNIDAYNGRGLLLLKLREPEAAIQDFSSALSRPLEDSIRTMLLINRGAAKSDIRMFQSAYDDYYEALQLDSLDIGTLNNLAIACDELGKGELAMTYLLKVIKIDPKFVPGYANLGFKYQLMGDYKSSLKYYDKELELDPKEPLGYSNRAYAKLKLGDLKGAMADVNMGIKLYPGNAYAYRNRALIYLAKGQKDKACQDITEGLLQGFTKAYGDELELMKAKECP